MAADSTIPPITCPSSMVASCAPLLGFSPEESVVAFVLGVPGRTTPVLARVDLPAPGGAPGWARSFADSIVGTGGRATTLLAWTEAPDDGHRALLPSTVPLDLLVAELLDRGVEVVTALSTNGQVVWSHDCPDDRCCARSWPLDAQVVSRVQAEYVYAGFAPLASRAELAESLAPDVRRSAQVARRLASAVPVRSRERWQEVELHYATWVLVPGGPRDLGRARTGAGDRLVGAPVPVRVALRLVRGVADLRVRDALLLRLITCRERDPLAWQRTLDLLVDVVRCAPDGHRAPTATLLGIVAWMSGEGALATVALEAAEADHPGYRLAALTGEVIRRGVDPVTWRRTMAEGLTEEECLGRHRPRWASPGGSSGSAPA
jgi:hypothetical protein